MRRPFWKKSHGCWYVKLGGKDTRLHPDKEEAHRRWHALVASNQPVTTDTQLMTLTNRFLGWSKKHNAKSTYEQYRGHLESFHRFVGPITFTQLKQHHVTAWIDDRYPNASPNTINLAVRSIQRMLNWNRKQGWVESVPQFHKPTPKPRDVYLLPEQYQALVALIKDQEFLDIVSILRETGCRPLEARTVEARHYQDGCWDFTREESKGQRDRRVVLLNDRARAITERLIEKHPTGPIFRNTKGRPWTKNALGLRCERIRKKAGFYVCPYAIRHSFATEAIVRGVDLISIANLMGHKDLKMLNRVYQHLAKRSDHLRKALDQATNDVRKAG